MHALGRTRRYLISALLSAAGVVVLWPAAGAAVAQAATTTSYVAPVVTTVSPNDAQLAHEAAVKQNEQQFELKQAAAVAAAAQAAKQQAAAQAAAVAAQQAVAQQAPPPPPPPPPAPVVSVGTLQAYALNLLGGDQTQFSCLNSVIMIESSWNVYAQNASGAYGIPQALPGSKMSAAGADWATNGETQIRWMVQIYIPGTYGTACNAWAHEQAYGWY